MLTKLTVSNYALISELLVEFQPGLNSVTGETGAGKSIILGALGLIIGNRADLSALKNKNAKCIIEGVFDVADYKIESFFLENDLDYDSLTILRREITPSGKSRAFINDTPVNLKVLGTLGLKLVDIHSQHQNLELANQKFQLDLVDRVSESDKIYNEYKYVYTNFKSLEKSLEDVVLKSEKAKADLDYFQFQFDKLEEANLQVEEQDELEIELKKLTHAEEIKNALVQTQEFIDGDRISVVQNLKDSIKMLENVEQYIPEIKLLTERLQSSFIEIKDILDEINQIAERTEYDPMRIEFVNDRLNLIYGLQQKHHVATVKELLEIKDSLNEKILRVTGFEDEIVEIKKQLKECRFELEKLGNELSDIRKKSFDSIEKSIINDLLQLGMQKSKFHIIHHELEDFGPTGKDAVSFLFSANVDAEPTEISKIASGGEMSRLMLSIKNLLRKSKLLPTVIFDEIDSGVSGEIALKMGNILKDFSKSTQIINITHLPQIAAKGDIHFLVYKNELDSKTYISVKKLSEKERIEELAKMVGGDILSDTTLKTAEQLLYSK